MGLQELPAEILSHILTFLPDLSPSEKSRTITVGPNSPLTPAVCRASHALRREALPLYAKYASFVIQTDEDFSHPRNRVRAWLNALGDEAIGKVRSLQLSQHWKLSQPTRWQGHVGFYVRLQLLERAGSRNGRDEWNCTVGTYPIVNDMRGMRLESVNLLRDVVVQRLRSRLHSVKGGSVRAFGLERADVRFVVEAMGVVARHPIEAFDVEHSEQGRGARRKVWESMESKLEILSRDSGDGDEANGSANEGSRFFTTY